MTAVNEHFEDELEADEPDIIRAKGILDGATTLAEAAQKAHDFAMHLQRLHAAGYVLDGPVDDDYAFYYKPEAP